MGINRDIFIKNITEIAKHKRIHLNEYTANSIANYMQIEKLDKNVMKEVFAELSAIVRPKLDGPELMKRYGAIHAELKKNEQNRLKKEEQRQARNLNSSNFDSDCKKEFFFLKRFIDSHEFRTWEPKERKILTEYAKNTRDTSFTIKSEQEACEYVSKQLAKKYMGVS